MRFYAAILIAGAVLLPAGQAGAGEFTISQKKKRFTPKQIDAKLGDTVLFINDDRYAHNLYSDTAGFEFDVGKQMPGDLVSGVVVGVPGVLAHVDGDGDLRLAAGQVAGDDGAGQAVAAGRRDIGDDGDGRDNTQALQGKQFGVPRPDADAVQRALAAGHDLAPEYWVTGIRGRKA